jgi:hypothetical protein
MINLEEWKTYFSFLDEVVFDSPHCGDDETMEWHQIMMDKLKMIILNKVKPIENFMPEDEWEAYVKELVKDQNHVKS